MAPEDLRGRLCPVCGAPLEGCKRQVIYCSQPCKGKGSYQRLVDRLGGRDAFNKYNSAKLRKYRDSDKVRAKLSAYKRRVYHERPETGLLANAKERARKLCLPFSITIKDVSIPSHCPLLGIELATASGRCSPGSPTLDRIVPSAGYVPGNVMVISHKANSIKSNASINEIELLARNLRRLVVGGTDLSNP